MDPETSKTVDAGSDIEKMARSLEETVEMNRECLEKGHVPIPGRMVPTLQRGKYWAFETCARCKEPYDRLMTPDEIRAFNAMLQQSTRQMY